MGVADTAVILDLSELIFAELGEYELTDFWFRILSKRRLKASDVLILCWEITNGLATRIAEIAKCATGFALRFSEVAGNGPFRTKELGGLDAV